MDNFLWILTVGLAVLTIATAAGLGLQRGTVTALRDRLKDNDEELLRKGRRLDEATVEIRTLKTDLAALARVVTGETHWVAIGHKLDEHHHEATTHWNKDERILGEIRDIVKEGMVVLERLDTPKNG